MIGRRTPLVDGHGHIDRAIVWNTLQAHLPALIATLELRVPPG
jgi:uncharacterized protein with HEPN domain